jgi:hypothetical protein
MRWADTVVFLKLNAGAHGDGFLAAADVNAPNDFPLPVQLSLDARLNFARQLHVVQHVEQRLLVELHGR